MDNPINSLLEARFSANVALLNLNAPITTAQKFWAIGEAVSSIPSSVVHNAFTNNGLRIDRDNPQSSNAVMSRLLSEGLHPAKDSSEMHCAQLEKYLIYHLAHHFDEPLLGTPLGWRLQGPLFDILNRYIEIQQKATI